MNDLSKKLLELRQRRQKSSRQQLRRGTLPNITFHDELAWRGGWIFLGTALVGFIISSLVYFSHHDGLFAVLEKAAVLGILTGLSMMLLYYVWPVLHIVLATLWHRQLPQRAILKRFSYGQKFASICLAGIACLFLGGEINLLWQGMPFAETLKWQEFSQPLRKLGLPDDVIICAILALILFFLLPHLLPRQKKENAASYKPLKTNFKGHKRRDLTLTPTLTLLAVVRALYGLLIEFMV